MHSADEKQICSLTILDTSEAEGETTWYGCAYDYKPGMCDQIHFNFPKFNAETDMASIFIEFFGCDGLERSHNICLSALGTHLTTLFKDFFSNFPPLAKLEHVQHVKSLDIVADPQGVDEDGKTWKYIAGQNVCVEEFFNGIRWLPEFEDPTFDAKTGIARMRVTFHKLDDYREEEVVAIPTRN